MSLSMLHAFPRWFKLSHAGLWLLHLWIWPATSFELQIHFQHMVRHVPPSKYLTRILNLTFLILNLSESPNQFFLLRSWSLLIGFSLLKSLILETSETLLAHSFLSPHIVLRPYNHAFTMSFISISFPPIRDHTLCLY